MKIEVIKDDKEDTEIQLDNQTVAEVLRVYLHEQGIKFAAWRREHPSKPVIMKIQSTGPVKKSVHAASEAIKKDIASLVSILKKKS